MTTKYKLVMVVDPGEILREPNELRESTFWRRGWNACRDLMLRSSPEPNGGTPESDELEIWLRNDLRYKAPEQITKTLTYHICLISDRLKKMELERNTLLARLNELSGETP